MIRLTLNAQSDPEIHLFHQSTIILGSDATVADLALPETDILPIHLKIIAQNGFLILTNDTNDPFVSVNGLPFGKKLLNSGDIIQVHQTTILFEVLPDEPAPLKEPIAEKVAYMEQEEEKVAYKNVSSFSLPFEDEVEAFKEDEFHSEDVDKYLKELEKGPLPEKKKPTSLKDDHLQELEEDHPLSLGTPINHQKEEVHIFHAWKWILLFILSLFTISAVAGTIIYFSVSERSEGHRTKAAQGMADIAMALTHAKLNQIKPHNQNWGDVEFLKTHLQSILPDSFSYASQIDAQGQFNTCPYSLRIYTDRDLTHFLLISQPAPNLLYWIVPQSILVIDSNVMELRALKDVRALNRLLANPDPLEGVNGKEITTLIKQGKLLPLAALAKQAKNQEFAPPENLALMRPGAENLIHNAPRYYRLSQKIVNRAIHLSTTKGSSQEVSSLKQDVENFGCLNPSILYSDQGMKSALLARQGLALFAPSDKVLFGYILLNAQGNFHQVHLLKEDEKMAELPHSPVLQMNNEELVSFHAAMLGIQGDGKNDESDTIDRNHPIYIQLHALANSRENELKPLITALFNLINQELVVPRAQFQVEYQNLSHAYLMANAKHKKALKETLDALFQQYDEIPIQQFLAFINELHLDQLIQQEDEKLAVIDENCQQNMVSLFTHIENSKSLAELDNIIHIASTWLNFDYIKDTKELLKYQNLLRNHVLEQLECCLLIQSKDFTLKAEDRPVLLDILNQERLIKPEERDFFLGEFDQIVGQDKQVVEEG